MSRPWRGWNRGALAAAAAPFAIAAVVASACDDYIDTSTATDGAADVVEVLDEAEAPPLPTPEAGGEPRRDSSTTLPPTTDASPDVRDSSTGG